MANDRIKEMLPEDQEIMQFYLDAKAKGDTDTVSKMIRQHHDLIYRPYKQVLAERESGWSKKRKNG